MFLRYYLAKITLLTRIYKPSLLRDDDGVSEVDDELGDLRELAGEDVKDLVLVGKVRLAPFEFQKVVGRFVYLITRCGCQCQEA